MKPQTGSDHVSAMDEAETVTHVPASPIEWSQVIAAAVPLAFVGAIATAYGFLEGNNDHPSLQLVGAFVVAALATVAVLMDRSSLLRHSPDVQVGQRTAFLRRDRRDLIRIGLVLVSVGAALIHFAVIEQHFAEYWVYGVFFIAIGLFELVWALLLMASPSRSLYLAGIVVNALTVVAYVITRTVGVLIGPSAAETEKIGFGDLVSTAFEVLIVLGCAMLLLRGWGHARLRVATSEAWIGTIAIGVTAFTILALFSAVRGSPFVSPAG